MTTVQESPQSTRDWFWTIPLATSAYNTVTSVYEGARDRNALTRFTIGTVESSVKLAGRCASPIVQTLENKFEKPLYAVDAFALKKLQELEASYPVIKKPSDEVLTEGKGALYDTWEKGSQRVCQYPGAKLIGSGISVGTSVIGSTIKMGQQGINGTINVGRRSINGTINAGRRSINTANNLVGRGVDQCLNATEVVVKYILPDEQDKSTLTEPLLISSSTFDAKKERHRRRQERRKRREMRRAHHLSKTWGGRFERTQDLVSTAMERSTDRMFDYLEWPMEHSKFVRTLNLAKAAATAYEMLVDYLEDAMDQLKALNPLRVKERKINLLTDSDDEEEEEEAGVLERLSNSVQTAGCAVVAFPVNLVVQAYELAFGLTVFVASQGRAISVKVYDESKEISIETVITKVTGLKDAIIGIIMSYVGYENEVVSTGTDSPSQTFTSMSSPTQTFTVMINQQGDTPAVENVYHSNSDNSEGSSDEGSSDHDPAHDSENDL